jgi:uncharacterized membrane protein YgcG
VEVASVAAVVAASAVAVVAASVGAEPAVAGSRRARARERVAAAVDAAEELTGLQFVVYLGPAGPDARARAIALLDPLETGARPDVALLVAPREHVVEIVTTPDVVGRESDDACAAAIERMLPHLRKGQFDQAIIDAVTFLADRAGPGRPAAGSVELPDVIDDHHDH